MEFVSHFMEGSNHTFHNQGWGWVEGFSKYLCLIAGKEGNVLIGSAIFSLKSFLSI